MSHTVFSKYSFEKIGSETKTIDRVGTNFLNSQISMNIHDQGEQHTVKSLNDESILYTVLTIYSGESYLCWAFGCSTMIRRSLIAFFVKYKNDSNLNLTNAEISEIETFVKSNKFHFLLRNQIVMNPIPKRLKKEETEEQRGPHEYHSLSIFLERVSRFYCDSL